jgi:hypothetical protein
VEGELKALPTPMAVDSTEPRTPDTDVTAPATRQPPFVRTLALVAFVALGIAAALVAALVR